MSLYEYFTGQQSWANYVSNRDLDRSFENALNTSADQIVVRLNSSDQQQAMAKGLGAIKDSLSDIASDLRYEVTDLSAGIDALKADFNLVMGDVIWKLELQSATLTNILRTLQAPLDTAAKELRARAEDAYRNGWYQEALDDFV